VVFSETGAVVTII